MEKTHKEIVKKHYNALASKRDEWKKKNSFYHKELENLCRFLIPQNKKIIELGCGTGDLLKALHPSIGVGIDIAEEMVKIA